MWQQLESVVFPKGNSPLITLKNEDVAFHYSLALQQRETLLHKFTTQTLTPMAFVHGQMMQVSPSAVMTT